ncbi:MAG: hypothetical protein ACLQO1_02905 [Steroidobacteraceae bacterium]
MHRWGWAIGAGAVLALILLLVMVAPGSIALYKLYWGRESIQRLFYEDLGFSYSWSSFIAVAASFFYALAWVPLSLWTYRIFVWKFNTRQLIVTFACWIFVYGHVPLLHALLGSDVCFNQRTGEPLKWFVVEPGGQIVLYDSPGYDTAGAPKRAATQQVCRVLQLQKKGLRPRAVRDDPRKVKFFDEITSQPKVWYSKGENGDINIFDGEGTDPSTGGLLKPITTTEVQELQAQAAAKQAETERAAQLKAEEDRQRAAEAERQAHREAELRDAEARENARKRLITLFDTASYSPGVVIVGALSQQGDDTSALAARNVLAALLDILRRKGVSTDEFRPQVYADGYFKTISTGNAAVLTDVGLSQKMRAAVLANVDVTCRPATSGLMSCAVTAELRILRPSGAPSLRSISETGAGVTTEQAVLRAAELVAQRHGDIFEGI